MMKRMIRVGALAAASLLFAGWVAAQANPTPAAPAATPATPADDLSKPGWNVPPKWESVDQTGQYASVKGRDTNILVQGAGHEWRKFRNGPLTTYGGWALVVVPALILLFYFVKGPFKLHDKPTGRLIERFNSIERVSHWTMAISFCVLAITGIVILWGKHVLLPLLGYGAFATLTVFMKNLHNFAGPLFALSIVLFFVIYVRDNFFNGNDITWLSKFGGLLSGKEVPSGRFNGGEKVWFWLSVVVLGVLVSVTGLILNFPNWNQGREIMQTANMLHAVGATLFMVLSLAHIYMGSIGTEGAYKSMRTGYVDETWAKEHHALWYEDIKSGKRQEKIQAAGAVQPASGD